jgi:hypothetical protein
MAFAWKAPQGSRIGTKNRYSIMASLDESLFGRIAVLNNYLRADQLEECLRIQRAESPPRRIGDILLEKKYLTEEQLRTILEIRRKKSRKSQANQGEVRENDKAFGHLALQSGLVNLDQLEGAILEQQRLKHLNLHFRLGEIMVAKRMLEASDVVRLLRSQGKQILLCPVCDIHYNVVRYQEGKGYRCNKCQSDLLEPKFLDTVAVDALIEG